MDFQTIKEIEAIIIEDASSPTGKRIIGFYSHYQNSRYLYGKTMFEQRTLHLVGSDSTEHEVHYDQSIEAIDIYHKQHGISVSDDHNCFFLCSWLRGIYCFDLFTGKLRWNYRLKHARRIVLCSDYLLCEFQDIGIRKISYEGIELDKYQMTTCEAFFALEYPYVFIGPKRNEYHIVDSSDMHLYQKVKSSSIAESSNPLILLNVTGNTERISVQGYKDSQRFSEVVDLRP